jgi:hypothetical protein
MKLTGSAPVTGISFSRAGTQIGSVNLSANSVTYNTVSDYRLKKVVGMIEEPINRVRELQPLCYVFKHDPEQIYEGFLAHQVAEIVPEAVQGDKDAKGSDG